MSTPVMQPVTETSTLPPWPGSAVPQEHEIELPAEMEEEGVAIPLVLPSSVPAREITALEGEGYITNGELLAWLANVSDGRYDEMRRLMGGCDDRRVLAKELTELRALMDEAKASRDYAPLLAAVNELLAAYEGTPHQPMLEDLLVGTAKAVEELATAGMVVKDESFDSWGAMIQGQIDSLGKEDQLMLISIQDLHGQINQQTQLTSNLMAAAARALDNTVANIRG